MLQLLIRMHYYKLSHTRCRSKYSTAVFLFYYLTVTVISFYEEHPSNVQTNYFSFTALTSVLLLSYNNSTMFING